MICDKTDLLNYDFRGRKIIPIFLLDELIESSTELPPLKIINEIPAYDMSEVYEFHIYTIYLRFFIGSFRYCFKNFNKILNNDGECLAVENKAWNNYSDAFKYIKASSVPDFKIKLNTYKDKKLSIDYYNRYIKEPTPYHTILKDATKYKQL